MIKQKRALYSTSSFLFFFILLVFFIEFSLQVRLYLQGRQGVIALLKNETKYIDRDGLKILNPRYKFDGFRVNSIGLRSNEYDSPELPIIFMGASTVMGEFARNNEDRFSEIFSKVRGLQDRHVNAGIAGYRVNDQMRLLARLTERFPRAHAIVIYPGFNDASDICTKSNRPPPPIHAPYLSAPGWTLIDKKIEGAFKLWPGRTRAASGAVDLNSFIHEFKKSVDAYFEYASQISDELIIVKSARSFKRPMSLEQRRQWAASVTIYSACLSVDQLEDVYNQMNAVVQESAIKLPSLLIDADAEMSGKTEFFVDATHFTRRGEEEVAAMLQRAGAVK